MKTGKSIFLGIDLGHHSIVTASSSAEEPLQVTVDANGLSNRSTPSILGIENNRVLYGEEAEVRLPSVPGKMLDCLPGRLGKDSHGPFEMGSSDPISLESSHLLSLFFRSYLQQVHPNADLSYTTISVPVDFTEQQTQIVVDAARLSGLEIGKFDVIDHIDSAMTLLNKGGAGFTGTVVLVDCGFSQTSVGVMVDNTLTAKKSIQSLSVERMIEQICEVLLLKQASTSAGAACVRKIKQKDPRLYFRLMKIGEKVLKDLSMLSLTMADLGDLEESLERSAAIPAKDVKKICGSSFSVTRDSFEALLLQEAGLAELTAVLKGHVQPGAVVDSVRVEVVGGGSRIPFIAKSIAAACGVASVGRGLDGSAFAALGAALWSAGRRDWPASRVLANHTHDSHTDRLTASRSLQEQVLAVHEKEVLRLKRKNDLETFLFDMNRWREDPDVDRKLVEEKSSETWKWFDEFEDGSAEGAEFAAKLEELKAFMAVAGKAMFKRLEKERAKSEKSLTANAEYLSSSASNETAADKRAKHGAAAAATVSVDQTIKLAGKNRDEGNDLFKHGTTTDAMNRYMRAINLLVKLKDLPEADKKAANQILLACNLNMAQCVVKLTAPGTTLSQEEKDGLLKRGIACADSALALDKTNGKAKFRKAVCLDRLRETEEAKRVIDQALQENPDDVDLKQLYDSLVATLKSQQSKAKQFFSKMFQ